MTPGCSALKPACQAVMAACCALEPAPTRSPLSSAEELPLALLSEPLLLVSSFEAPQAAVARTAASDADTAAARVVVLSFNSVPFDWCARTS
ncbi:protein of unknown function [Modestobacter italicus]|uniref:Uncharacterized protein n=1 Tax=Modestobacter italicus (strain DSM 44449 / CECT 9708 / BC 501) TaxID=2732864 RepID=I4F468_MODI5|nr:protein of unknown function [Modestobacter marinus]